MRARELPPFPLPRLLRLPTPSLVQVVHHQERVRQKHAKKAPCSSSYPAAEMTVVSHSPAVSDNTKTATGTPRQLEDDFSSQYDSDVGHGSGRGRGGLMVGKGPKSDERGA